MSGYIIAALLWIIGIIGFKAVVQDLQKKPIKTARAKVALVFWPPVVIYGWLGDIYDHYRRPTKI